MLYITRCNLSYQQRSVLDVGLLINENHLSSPLHPCIKSDDLYSEMHRVAEADGDPHMRRVIEGHDSYKCKLLSSIRFDGTPQELPVCTIHCSRSYKISPEAKHKTGRFDFLELKIVEEDIPDGARETDLHFAQVAAILAISKRGHCVGLYMLCLWLEELHSRNGPEWGDLTPRCFRYLAYQKNSANQVHRQLLKVDYILTPGFVTPLTCKSVNLIKKSSTDMFKVRFTAIDSTFFTRGGVSHLRLEHHLLSKQDTFPKNKQRILPFYLYEKNDLSPESQQVHEKYLPNFVKSGLFYPTSVVMNPRTSDTNDTHDVISDENLSVQSHDYSIDTDVSSDI